MFTSGPVRSFTNYVQLSQCFESQERVEEICYCKRGVIFPKKEKEYLCKCSLACEIVLVS